VCQINAQCCTGACVALRCADTICSDDTYKCAANNECCSKFCDPLSGRCAEPKACVGPGEACLVPEECCGDSFTCQHDPGSITGKCADSMCLRIEAECATDNQCCSGHCDATLFACGPVCSDQSALCTVDTDCCSGQCQGGVCKASCSVGYCAVDEDCCTGECLSGVCAPACNEVAFHRTCEVGGPLDSMSNNAVVNKVCAADPYCCCGSWDAPCVLAANSTGEVCADP
jgi:hypothetical protein